MSRPLDIDIYSKHLFTDVAVMAQQKVPPMVQQRILRLRAIYDYWLCSPSVSPRDIVQWAVTSQDIAERTAYDDVWIVKQLLGNLNEDSRQWHQYNFNQKILEVYRRALSNDDYKTAGRALADYARYNRLDQEEDRQRDYDDVSVTPLSATIDPRTIGIEPLPNLQERIRKLNRSLSREPVDADYEEVMEEAQKTGEDHDGGIS